MRMIRERPRVSVECVSSFKLSCRHSCSELSLLLVSFQDELADTLGVAHLPTM